MSSTLCDIRLNKEDVPTDGCPRQTDDHSGSLYSFLDLFLQLELARSKQFDDHVRSNDEFGVFAFQNSSRVFAANTRNLPLQISDASLPCVVADNLMQSLILEFDLVGLNSTIISSSRHQVITGNLHLLFLG